MIAATMLVYDTVKFGEVSSRLLNLVEEQATNLRDLSTALDTVPAKSTAKSKSAKTESPLNDILYAATGLGLIAKNVLRSRQ